MHDRSPAIVDDRLRELVERAVRLEKYPIAKLISLFERADNSTAQGDILGYLHAQRAEDMEPRPSRVIGMTGSPGAGKSTLLGKLALSLINRDPRLRIAVVAVDPSSVSSGGALLGDRMRTHFPVGEPRIFFRSQAAAGDLGGVSRRTFSVVRVLEYLFDLIFVETVGIGQSEVEIGRLADTTVLVMQPLAGDHVQFMKCGIMEIPSAFVIHKCDEDALARRSLHELERAVEWARVGSEGTHRLPIFQTSAITGRGIDDVAEFVMASVSQPVSAARHHDRAVYFLRKEIADRYGRFGLVELDRLLDVNAEQGDDPTWYDRVLANVLERIRSRIR
ncbi:MAG: protein kinase [Deltaproteobacteria bacterium]|nr:protein kinase [Deltaproteobacteria bacterium]